MKYYLGFNQERWQELYPEADVVAAIILETLRSFSGSSSNKIKRQMFEDGMYVWASYQLIMNELPILKIKSKSAISERIKTLKKWGLIKTHFVDRKYLYIRLTPEADSLEYKFGGVRLNEQLPPEGVRLGEQGVRLNERILIQDKDNKDIAASAAEDQEFNFSGYLQSMFENPRKHIQALAIYSDELHSANRLEPWSSEEEAEAFISRNVRPGKMLAAYSPYKIRKTVQYMLNVQIKGRPMEFSIETVLDWINKKEIYV